MPSMHESIDMRPITAMYDKRNALISEIEAERRKQDCDPLRYQRLVDEMRQISLDWKPLTKHLQGILDAENGRIKHERVLSVERIIRELRRIERDCGISMTALTGSIADCDPMTSPKSHAYHRHTVRFTARCVGDGWIVTSITYGLAKKHNRAIMTYSKSAQAALVRLHHTV